MRSLAARLLPWYERHRRRLPWRENPQPYRVWVSELMLQQTQVSTVLPYFERFLERFPNVGTLAAAEEHEVLAAWSGLGYYHRARSLHRAARILVERNGGKLPEDVAGWMALPGVGRYTAGAIVSIAYGARAPILDGNVARVLSRLFCVEGELGKSDTRRALWNRAEEILPARRIAEFNQALMELGALVCLPGRPRCLVCPLEPDCGARKRGLEQELPRTPPRPPSVGVTMAAAVVEEKGRLLLYRRSAPGLMEGLWELPGGECLPGEEPRDAVVREARARYGISLRTGTQIARVKHSIMNRRITLHAFDAVLEERPGRRRTAHRWVAREQIDEMPVSSMLRKVLRSTSD